MDKTVSEKAFSKHSGKNEEEHEIPKEEAFNDDPLKLKNDLHYDNPIPNRSNNLNDINSQNIKINKPYPINEPKLSQNAQKLKDLEDKMAFLESSISEMKTEFSNNKNEKAQIKEEINSIHSQTKEINDEFKTNLSTRITKTFQKEFDLASRKVIEHEDARIKAEDQNYEYGRLIDELDDQNYQSMVNIRKLEEQLGDLKSEYEFLKESYDEAVKDNSQLREDNIKKDEKITSLSNELEDVKNVIGKLTEVRVILNKYFSSYFENFT
jgi:chromosome segregation ATPase